MSAHYGYAPVCAVLSQRLRRNFRIHYYRPPQQHLTSSCLVRLKIARDAPRLLGLAIYVWTIPAQVVQIHIATSATGASEACRAAAARSASPSSRVYRRNGSARTPSRERIVRRRPQGPSARRHRHPLLTG